MFYCLSWYSFYRCEQRIDNIGEIVVLPKEWTTVDVGNSGLFPVFIVNAQVCVSELLKYFTMVIS
jgi:hypothetical protein